MSRFPKVAWLDVVIVGSCVFAFSIVGAQIVGVHGTDAIGLFLTVGYTVFLGTLVLWLVLTSAFDFCSWLFRKFRNRHDGA